MLVLGVLCVLWDASALLPAAKGEEGCQSLASSTYTTLVRSPLASLEPSEPSERWNIAYCHSALSWLRSVMRYRR